MKENSAVKDAVIITVICLVAGILLGLVHGITAAPIAAEEAKNKNEACKAVFADAQTFEEVDYDADALAASLKDAGLTKTTVNSVSAAKDTSGKGLGYVIDSTNSEGYGGDIEVMVGIKNDGTINGIRFLSISETAGMGMKAKEPQFTDQFKGMKAEQIKYTKTGRSGSDEIDAVSGATVTTKAVTKAVNGALKAFSLVSGQ